MDISIPDELARAYECATDEDKRKARWLVELVLHDLFDNQPESLNEVMQDISQKAAERGITPQILDDLLRE